MRHLWELFDNWRGYWAFLALALLSITIVVYGFDGRWFEDDAFITMQYSKNLAAGCGWSFNCGADDFATTSIAHALFASIAFAVAGSADSGLWLVKIYESTLIVLGILAFWRMLVVAGIGQIAALIASVSLLTNDNTFVYLSSGMENALNLLVMSGALTASMEGRYLLTGGLTGLAHLVRPESVLVGPVSALVELIRGTGANLHDWLKKWAAAGAVSFAVVAPVWLTFSIVKGTPLPVSGEVKLITASNWGPFHEELWPLVAHELHWLPFAVAGIAVTIVRRSEVLAPLLLAAVLVAVYSLAGLPKSPWYYLPLHFGFFAAVAAGMDFLFGAVKNIRPWLQPAAQVLLVVLLLSPIIGVSERFSQSITLIHARAEKRNDINGRTGKWLKQYAPRGAKAAIPNIGYIGFYSDIELVDIIGLVTPDIARNRDNKTYWYDTYRPEFWGDKAVPWHAAFDDPKYELVAVKGAPKYRRERYAMFLRSDLAETSIRRAWTYPGKNLQISDSNAGLSSHVNKNGIEISITSEYEGDVTLVVDFESSSLKDETFPGSDLVVDIAHELPKLPLKQIAVTLRSESAVGRGQVLFLMKHGLLSGRRQHSVLSQENIRDDAGFDPAHVVQLELSYKFVEQPDQETRLIIEHVELISVAGCRLAHNCAKSE